MRGLWNLSEYVLTWGAECAARDAGARLTQEVVEAAQAMARARQDVYQGQFVVFTQDVKDAMWKVYGGTRAKV